MLLLQCHFFKQSTVNCLLAVTNNTVANNTVANNTVANNTVTINTVTN